MKAKMKFIRLDMEADEPELVFEMIPISGDGAYRKNRWFVRYPLYFVEEEKEFVMKVKKARGWIGTIMGIDVDSADAVPY